jgi:hypothetical protein
METFRKPCFRSTDVSVAVETLFNFWRESSLKVMRLLPVDGALLNQQYVTCKNLSILVII